MESILIILFFISAFIIFWAMIGYSLSLKIINRFFRKKNLSIDYSKKPSVSLIIVAHNEEKVILEKLKNIVNLDYPEDKIEIIVSSDHSNDKTNEIVEEFIKRNSKFSIKLYRVNRRMGKTNAQNEAQKIAKNEILVLTDANSIIDPNAINELVAPFVASQKVGYVCGKLVLVNHHKSMVAKSEKHYWDSNLLDREIESNIQTITAGNGALYACRTDEYYDFPLLRCHDGIMPIYYALQLKRALYNPNAIAYEKAGESIEDEFKRKVRMNRGLLFYILPDWRILNFIRYRWFTYFYFGHRSCRYLLWISHLSLFLINIYIVTYSLFFLCTFFVQSIFFILALVQSFFKSKNRYLNLIYYYCVTIIAQWVGVYNILLGKTKPYWEKAESTR